MNFKESIKNYRPINEQEAKDQEVILTYIDYFPENILKRDNAIAHITSSGFIMNTSFDKVLMIHHNILKKWAWTGGHADGENDLLKVALKEAMEETGVTNIQPLFHDIASLDILPVPSHQKRGKYVNTHLHLSVAYILICDEKQILKVCPDENTGVEWLSIEEINANHFDAYDCYLYQKLIHKAKSYRL